MDWDPPVRTTQQLKISVHWHTAFCITVYVLPAKSRLKPHDTAAPLADLFIKAKISSKHLQRRERERESSQGSRYSGAPCIRMNALLGSKVVPREIVRNPRICRYSGEGRVSSNTVYVAGHCPCLLPCPVLAVEWGWGGRFLARNAASFLFHQSSLVVTVSPLPIFRL